MSEKKEIEKTAYVVGHARAVGLKIKKGDTRMPGDPVPECINWKQQVLGSHLSLGWIVTKDQYDLREAGEKDRLKQLKKKKDEERARRKKASTELLEQPGIKEDSVPAGDGEIIDSKEGDDASDSEDVTSDSDKSDDDGTDDESKGDKTESQETVTTDESALDLSKYDKNQLVDLAKSLNLSIRGNKDDLKKRILSNNEE